MRPQFKTSYHETCTISFHNNLTTFTSLKAFDKSKRVVFLTSPKVRSAQSQFIFQLKKKFERHTKKSVDIIIIRDGEPHKNLQTYQKIISKLVALKCDRHTHLIAIGGGVITDMAGFVATTFMRGITFSFIPTTLMAMVDASVGGKNGLDYNGKNLIGTIAQPHHLIIFTDLLATLNTRDYHSAWAEVIKHALLQGPQAIKKISRYKDRIIKRDSKTILKLIKENIDFKLRIVSQDVNDSHTRQWLNLGHTIGHALETATDFKTYTHGEAVALGMALEMQLLSKLNIIPFEFAQQVINVLDEFGLLGKFNPLPASTWKKLLQKDKKKKGQMLTLTAFHPSTFQPKLVSLDIDEVVKCLRLLKNPKII